MCFYIRYRLKFYISFPSSSSIYAQGTDGDDKEREEDGKNLLSDQEMNRKLCQLFPIFIISPQNEQQLKKDIDDDNDDDDGVASFDSKKKERVDREASTQ